jgi:hypothetical protein
MKRNGIALRPLDYGHWWFEIGNPLSPAAESYGWWPQQPFSGKTLSTVAGTLTGVPGSLNGVPGFPGTATRDPYHGTPAEVEFHPCVGLLDPRTDPQIAQDLVTFASGYAAVCGGRWRWTFGAGPNCRTFQKAAMRQCRLRPPKWI